MPRTAPNITDPQTWRQCSVRFIDSRSDMFSLSFLVGDQTTNGEINTFVTSLATMTNANIYEVVLSDVFHSPADPTDAVNAVFSNTDSIVGVLFKDNSNPLVSVRLEVPAPVSGLVLNGETVDDTFAGFSALMSQFAGVISNGAATHFTPNLTRFTERRNKNSARRI